MSESLKPRARIPALPKSRQPLVGSNEIPLLLFRDIPDLFSSDNTTLLLDCETGESWGLYFPAQPEVSSSRYDADRCHSSKGKFHVSETRGSISSYDLPGNSLKSICFIIQPAIFCHFLFCQASIRLLIVMYTCYSFFSTDNWGK